MDWDGLTQDMTDSECAEFSRSTGTVEIISIEDGLKVARRFAKVIKKNNSRCHVSH